ncbi:MAG: tetratricopeptide repeat protein [Kofleriaceae bacterium]
MNAAGRAALERAQQAEAAGDHAGAAASFDELVTVDPEDCNAWSVRGLFLERQRRFTDACESFRRSTVIKPSYCDHYNAGNMLHALARNDEALVEYDAALACDPKQAEGWCNRGIALFALGKTDEARTSFDRAIGLDDKLTNAYHCKAVLLQKLGDKGAITLRRKLIELAPSAAAYIDLANALRNGLGHVILWEPGGIEEQIVDALEHALELPCEPKQKVWCWAERLVRLQRIAHGRQAARRAGVPVEEAAAIDRFHATAEAGARQYPADQWFADMLTDAQVLKASVAI